MGIYAITFPRQEQRYHSLFHIAYIWKWTLTGWIAAVLLFIVNDKYSILAIRGVWPECWHKTEAYMYIRQKTYYKRKIDAAFQRIFRWVILFLVLMLTGCAAGDSGEENGSAYVFETQFHSPPGRCGGFYGIW